MTKLYIDSASVQEWTVAAQHALIRRATCNPLLMVEAGLPVNMDSAKALHAAARKLGFEELHLQAWPNEKNDWTPVAEQLAALDHRVVVKLPAVPEAMVTAKRLKSQESRVLITAVSNPLHGLWAAEIGADYVAPYVGRLKEAGRDATALVSELVSLQVQGGPKVLAASIRDLATLGRLINLGVGAVTLRQALLQEAMADAESVKAVEQFELARKQSLK
jgi:transaldolase